MSILRQLAEELGVSEDGLRDSLSASDEALTPTYLTTDASGKVSAKFTGHISAQGLELPAVPHFGIPENEPQSLVEWLDRGDGSLEAAIYGVAAGGLMAWAPPNKRNLLAQDNSSDFLLHNAASGGRDFKLSGPYEADIGSHVGPNVWFYTFNTPWPMDEKGSIVFGAPNYDSIGINGSGSSQADDWTERVTWSWGVTGAQQFEAKVTLPVAGTIAPWARLFLGVVHRFTP